MRAKSIISFVICLFIVSDGIVRISAEKNVENIENDSNGIENITTAQNVPDDKLNDPSFEVNGYKKKHHHKKNKKHWSKNESDKEKQNELDDKKQNELDDKKQNELDDEKQNELNVKKQNGLDDEKNETLTQKVVMNETPKDNDKLNQMVLLHLMEISKNDARIDDLFQTLKRHENKKNTNGVKTNYWQFKQSTESPKNNDIQAKDLNNLNTNKDFMSYVNKKLAKQVNMLKYLVEMYIAKDNTEKINTQNSFVDALSNRNQKIHKYMNNEMKYKLNKYVMNNLVDRNIGKAKATDTFKTMYYYNGYPNIDMKKTSPIIGYFQKISDKNNERKNIIGELARMELTKYIIAKMNNYFVMKYLSGRGGNLESVLGHRPNMNYEYKFSRRTDSGDDQFDLNEDLIGDIDDVRKSSFDDEEFSPNDLGLSSRVQIPDSLS